MNDPYKFFLAKLNLNKDEDKKIKDFYNLCYELIWRLYDLPFEQKSDHLANEAARSLLYQINKEKFDDFFIEYISYLNSKLEIFASQKNQSVNEFILSLPDIPDKLDNIDYDKSIDSFAQEWLSFPKSIFEVTQIIINNLIKSTNSYEADVTRQIVLRNSEKLRLLNERIKSVLFEKTMIANVKLEDTPVSLFKNILDSAFEQYKIELIPHCLSAKRICEKVNDEFNLKWKRATFERYCEKHRINWKKMAEIKSIEVCKEKRKQKKTYKK